MAPYTSRLNAVLEERTRRQDRLQRELAVEKQRLLEEEHGLQKMIEASEAALHALKERQKKPGIPGEIEMYHQFVSHQAKKIKRQEESVSAQRLVFEAKRKALEEAMREKKTVEKIETKRKDIFLASLRKKETAFLDELGGRIERKGLQ